jgi:hypothetical protein
VRRFANKFSPGNRLIALTHSTATTNHQSDLGISQSLCNRPQQVEQTATMSAPGQKLKSSQRANLVRFTLNNGHCASQWSGPLRATNGHSYFDFSPKKQFERQQCYGRLRNPAANIG